MNNKPLNRSMSQARWLISAALLNLATLLLVPSAQAAIAILDAPTSIAAATAAGSTYTKSCTVSAGASVLVVIIEDRQGGTVLAEPATITWNGQTLTLDKSSLANASNYRSMAMYHLYNPPAGTANVSATYSAANNTVAITTFTLSGVDNTTAPIILEADNSGTVSTISAAATLVTAGSWAALGSCWGASATLTPSGTGGTVTQHVVNNNIGGSTMDAGCVQNLSAGSVTIAVGSTASTKVAFIAEIFAPAPLPSTPANLVATAGSPAQVVLTWNASSAATSYNVKRSTTSSSETTYTNVTGTSYTDTQVISGTKYYYDVSAVNAVGESANSSEVNATPSAPPFPPAGLTAKDTGSSQVTLNWTGSFGATSYNVKQATASGAETTVASTSSTSCVINGLVNGTTYFFIVSSVGVGGETNSTEVTIAASSITVQDGNPLAITPYTAGGTALSQSFTATAGASVMVVCIEDRGANLTEPATLTWGSQTLTRDVQTAYNNGNARSLAIYHLFNPIAGTANITGTFTATLSYWAVTAYTLNGVDTTIAPITGNINTGGTGGTNNLTITLAGVAGGSWAAVNALTANNGQPVYINGTNAANVTLTGTTVSDTNATATTFSTAGYVAGLGAGANVLSAYQPGTGGQKENFAVDIFSPPSPPSIVTQPKRVIVFTNGAPQFSGAASGTAPLYYQWFTNSTTALSDSAHIVGSTSNVLTILGAALTDTANYTLVVTNIYGAATSSVANLTVVAPSSAYEAGVAALAPVAYYELNETGDPATNNTVAYDSANGFNGIYGTAVKNGNSLYNIQGPQPSTGFPGFASGNLAAQFTNSATAVINLPAWNLNTNGWTGTTLTAWINPSNSSASFEPNGGGIVMTRATGNTCGLNYINATNAGNRVIGYSWNNDNSATWSWNSGLFAPSNQWSLVVLSVTPTNAIIYVINTNSIMSATNILTHVPMAFNGTTMIGQGNTGNGGTSFIGAIDEVAAFGQALTRSQVITLFTNASGAGTIPTSLTILSSANPAGYLSSLTFTATNLPVDATSNVVFQVNGVAFSTNSVANGGATSLAINSLPRGTTNIIIATYTGDNNYFHSANTLSQVVTNHPPVANVMTVTRTAGLALTIALSSVATNWLDSDNDPVELTGVTMQSTNGINLLALNWSTNLDGSIVTTNAYAYIGYTNSPNVADQISYSISDGQGGTNIGYVNIVINSSVSGTNSITQIQPGNPTTVTAYGIPGYSYILERATNLAPAIWVDVATNTAATNGVISVFDSFMDLGGTPPTSAYYQLKWQP